MLSSGNTHHTVPLHLRKHGKQQGDEDQFTDKQVLYSDEVAKQAGVRTLLNRHDHRLCNTHIDTDKLDIISH